MVAHIYIDKNYERPALSTFSHLFQICGSFSTFIQNKKKEGLDFEDALCKALGWYFPLMAKFKVLSIEEIIYRKYPNVCPYCRQSPHNDKICKTVKGTMATVDHPSLIKKYKENQKKIPVSLNEWQEMFQKIYPRDIDDFKNGRSVLGLFEELAELEDAIECFEKKPKYLAGEAADVFSYLMGIANEYAIEVEKDGKIWSFEEAFLKRYPGICIQCGNMVCNCPPVPESTIGRMAKELDLFPLDSVFNLDINELSKHGSTIANEVMDQFGGYSIVTENIPFDRGETNRALIVLCLRISENLKSVNKLLSEKFEEIAIKIGSEIKNPGSKRGFKWTDKILELFNQGISHKDLEIFKDDKTISGKLGRMFNEIMNIKIGIITALPKEFAAMKIMLENSRQWPPIEDDPNIYELGIIPAVDKSGDHLVIVTFLHEMGNNSASVAAANLLRSFPNIEDIMMVGIAGGIPDYLNSDKHVRLGDIVVSDQDGVIQYDYAKGITMKPSAKLLGQVKLLESKRIYNEYPWLNYIDRGKRIESGTRPPKETDKLFRWDNGTEIQIDHPQEINRKEGEPKIHYGRIGAANNLLKDHTQRDELKKKYSLLAVEMEGSGVADGTWASGKGYLLIRGIADYCDSNKNDSWQGYASVVAAAYARCLIESIPIPKKTSKHQIKT
jgi:nucleoside phosphorylase/NTP pyrophosphatase (non-canonical NTP hydrolase)